MLRGINPLPEPVSPGGEGSAKNRDWMRNAFMCVVAIPFGKAVISPFLLELLGPTMTPLSIGFTVGIAVGVAAFIGWFIYPYVKRATKVTVGLTHIVLLGLVDVCKAILAFCNGLSRSRRVVLLAGVAWALYVAFRTSDSYQFLGYPLNQWDKDSLSMNLFLPPLAVVAGYVAYRWVSKGKAQ